MGLHNELADQGLKTFRMGVNQFADLSQSEIDQFMSKSFIKSNPIKANVNQKLAKPSTSPMDDSIDWRTKGIVGPVRNQGTVGYPSPFAVVGAVEGLLAQTNKNFTALSVQQVVDCSNSSRTDTDSVYEYLMLTTVGLEADASYPVRNTSGNCAYDPKKSVVIVEGYETYTSGKESQLQQGVANGVLSIELHVADDFMLYASGIYSTDECKSTDQANHALLAVGYGTTVEVDHLPYWILQNSWGSNWGEQGAIRFARNDNNLCGIASHPSAPILMQN